MSNRKSKVCRERLISCPTHGTSRTSLPDCQDCLEAAAEDSLAELRKRLAKLTEQRDEAMSHAQALRGDFGDDACLQAEDALTELINTVHEEVQP